MAALFLLVLLDTWPVAYARALARDLKSYDLVRMDVRVVPARAGLEVACRLDVRVERPGPLRFLLSSSAAGLEVRDEAGPLEASLAAGAFGDAVRLLAPGAPDVPGLLTVVPRAPPEPGTTLALRLRYVWRPPAGGVLYARTGAVQTHLNPFWLPAAGEERFAARVEVVTDRAALAPGAVARTSDGWRFETRAPVQVVPLVVGDFAVARREAGGRALEVWTPPGADLDAAAVLDDLALVLARLEAWFGPAAPDPFRVVVEPRPAPAPSYCGGDFVVLDRLHLPAALGRTRWLALLAHECAHVWWGHRVASPALGRGGTWVREGLAQWSGVAVAGALAGDDAARDLWRAAVRGYLGPADVRRSGPRLFANEVPLRDATYVDDLRVPYLRGALVFRLIEARLGPAAFRERLAALAGAPGPDLVGFRQVARALDAGDLARYYASTTALPDLRLHDVRADGRRVRAEVRVDDPDWPGGAVPILVRTTRGGHVAVVDVRAGRGALDWSGDAEVVALELDPERVWLDVRVSNNRWAR